MLYKCLFLILSYFLGSIPFGLLLVKISQGKDIRKFGSGNIGATNVYRKSRITGVLTLLLDGGKGALAVTITLWFIADPAWQALAALAAIIGHVFPVWLGFKGGKGVATGCGAYLVLCPFAVLTTLLVFVLILVSTRYISAASIIATALFPLWAYYPYGYPLSVILLGAAGALVIIVKHHQNIGRLFSGTEDKFMAGSGS